MTILYHYDIEQGTDEWHNIRRGKITASAIGAMLTPSRKIANNQGSREAVYRIAAERITDYTDETATTFAMQRGHDDEALARQIYTENTNAPVTECGFVMNDEHGVTICCSPDGLVHSEGGIEVKSRLHNLQLETILSGDVPAKFVAQIQTCLLVTGRKWWDFCSFPAFGGGKMMVKTCEVDLEWREILIEAATVCEQRVQEVLARYQEIVDKGEVMLFDAPRRSADDEEVRIVL